MQSCVQTLIRRLEKNRHRINTRHIFQNPHLITPTHTRKPTSTEKSVVTSMLSESNRTKRPTNNRNSLSYLHGGIPVCLYQKTIQSTIRTFPEKCHFLRFCTGLDTEEITSHHSMCLWKNGKITGRKKTRPEPKHTQNTEGKEEKHNTS